MADSPFTPYGAGPPGPSPLQILMQQGQPQQEPAPQQFAANSNPSTQTVAGPGNTKFVLTPNGWMQHDNFGPVGLMPPGWSPPPVRAPGR